MDNPWRKLNGDAPGEILHTNLAASIATLVRPGQVAVKIEAATEVRVDKNRTVLLINPDCVIRGTPARSGLLIDQFKSGDLEKEDPEHPLLDCMAGLHNCHALLDWMKRGEPQRLVYNAGNTRSFYVPGPAPLTSNVVTISTKRLAVAAALGRLGIALYNILGSGNNHEFVLHRFSRPMLNEAGDPVVYDGRELIEQLNAGILQTQQPDHPFLLAYCARQNRERLLQHLNQDQPLLLLTPDAVRKSGRYNPEGLHAYISPNAKGDVWDQVEKYFFG